MGQTEWRSRGGRNEVLACCLYDENTRYRRRATYEGARLCIRDFLSLNALLVAHDEREGCLGTT